MGTWVDKPKAIDISGSTSLNLVNERFDLTQAFAAETYEATKGFIGDLQEIISELTPPSTDGIDDVTMPTVPALDYTSRPRLGNVVIPDEWPTSKPTAPVLYELPEIEDVTFPVLSYSPPSWNNPQKPSLDMIDAPGSAPEINTPDLPGVPDISLPNAPTIDTISLPSPPTSTLQEFNEELAIEDISIDGVSFNWQESPYVSEIWSTLVEKVADGIRDGGTGLAPGVEQEIWDRAQRRQQAENEKLYRETEEYFASRGWPMPPGAMAGRLAEVSQEIAKNNTDLNGKIAIEQAELAQKNTHFLLDKGVNLEQILREFFTATANRSLDAAKTVVGSAIDLFNARVAGYNLKVERYKALVAAYESRVRAALEAVEIFKAQIEGARVTTEVQKNLIEIYTRQIGAIETRVRLYSAQMDGAKVAAEIEGLKLEQFKLTTQVYVSRLEAERIKFDIYGKEVDAEAAKAQVFSEQVKAYVAEVDATKAKTALQVTVLEAAAARNNQLIEQYKGELTGYTAEIDAAAKKVDGVVRGFEAEARAYSAETEAESAMYGAKVKEIEARIMQSKFLIEKAVAQIESATKGYVAIKELQVKGVEGAMNVGAQLSSAAMNAVNATASIGYNQSRSEEASYNTSQSLSEQHQYQEKG
jgi:hypothetical protein